MDFKNLDAESLIAAMPETEDASWELKSASLLDPKNKGDFKKELGKQVSAFANSGGGYIVFGIADCSRTLEACPTVVGRQSMEDYLSTMVEQSVEYPLQSFQVHRIAFRNDLDSVIFVVEVEDSPAAPHQAKGEYQYYYRIPGHSKPAPHFHLELLRHRETKCSVAPHFDSVDWNIPWYASKGPAMSFKLNVVVQNQASFVAMPVGVSVRGHLPGSNWTINNEKERNQVDFVMSDTHLFPGLSHVFVIEIDCVASKDEKLSEIVGRDLSSVILEVRAFSQNYGSRTLDLKLSDHVSVYEVRDREAAIEAEKKKSELNLKDLLPAREDQISGFAEQIERLQRPPNIQLPGVD